MAPPFVFEDYRGLVQLRLATAEDLEHVHDLDPTRWSSTSVPVEQLLCDAGFTKFMDEDANGRIRVKEVQAAHRWLVARLRNRKRIAEATDTVHLADLDTSTPDGARLEALARQRIKGQDVITLAQIREFRASYTKIFPNGDGVVTPAQISDDATRAFAVTVVTDQGGVDDLSGEKGVDRAQLDAFLAHAEARLAWEAEGASSEAQRSIHPLGDATADAVALVDGLAPKLDQFFAQCDFIEQEKAGAERLTETAESLKSIDVRDTEALRSHLRAASLARLDPRGVLALDGWLNPFFADDIRLLAREVLPKVLGVDGPITALTRAEWTRVRGAFDTYRAWLAKKPADVAGGLTGDALRAIVGGPAPSALRALADEDERASEELQAISDLEKLALYQRWLLPLVNNMISFPALFSGKERCLFETGTLVLDGREMNLCVKVADVGDHKPLADQSNIFVLYVDCERAVGGAAERMTIAVGVTSGTQRGIAAGKRGVFYDREGCEWDAKVIDMLVKPISLFESAVAPFVKLRQLAADKASKLMSSKLDTIQTRATETVDARVTAGASAALNPNLPSAEAKPAETPKPAAPPQAAAPAGGTTGALVGGSIAFAAIGSALAFVVQTITSIDPVSGLLVIAGVVLSIMGLSGFLGWLRLRRRDVSTLLEACGWAFNVRIYLKHALSLRFTRVPPLPSGAVRERSVMTLVQAEEEPSSARWLVPLAVLLAAAAIAWQLRAMWWEQVFGG
jgi:hypothetical protein